jgi:hypothetical protein
MDRKAFEISTYLTCLAPRRCRHDVSAKPPQRWASNPPAPGIDELCTPCEQEKVTKLVYSGAKVDVFSL